MHAAAAATVAAHATSLKTCIIHAAAAASAAEAASASLKQCAPSHQRPVDVQAVCIAFCQHTWNENLAFVQGPSGEELPSRARGECHVTIPGEFLEHP